MTGRLIALTAAAVVVAAWSPTSALRATGADAATVSGLSAAFAELATAMLGVLVVWLAAAVTARGLRRCPGLLGRAADGVWQLLVPAVLRAGVVAALGVSAVATPAVALDEASTAPVASLPVASLPVAGVPVVARPQVGTAQPDGPPPVQVEPGDSLWRIAARSLGEGATAADVAGQWPRWYERNRSTIGPDPDLLLVGMLLTPPSTVDGPR
jgi:nucleoid-associated protein YgaU